MAGHVAIIGDGQMGLVLARLLADKGVAAALWGPFPKDIDVLRVTRTSPHRLPGFRLPDSVRVLSDAREAVEGASAIIAAIPTQFIRGVWERLREGVPDEATILSVAKGIEQETLLCPLEIIAEVLGEPGDLTGRPMVCVSGPTIAAELAGHRPATVVAAAHDEDAGRRAQQLLTTTYLRVYRHDDVRGVELAGATKNVIALAAGMVDGLALGYNAKSALLARGLAEIARLGIALGARQETFFGLAGVGDLATTCFCPLGRNRTCGERLGRGETLDEILESTASIIEGVSTTKSVHQLAREHAIDMPITDAVYAILFEGLPPRDAIVQLMERELKAERVG